MKPLRGLAAEIVPSEARLSRWRTISWVGVCRRQFWNEVMSKERIYLFDTTLRDGQQTPGIDFSVEDKIAIARMLDEFGIDYVEGGYPGANPTDTRFLPRSEPRQRRSPPSA
jgi:hypothetical protein